MNSTISVQDRLDLLVALPPTRLCQMLCVWSQFEEQDRIWSLLVWVEASRLKRPAELSGRARGRLKKALFPARSLDRLLDQGHWYDPTVFELVTETLLAPLLAAALPGLDPEPLLTVLEGWNYGTNHPFFAVRSLLDALPEKAARAVMSGGRLDLETRAGRSQNHKRVPQLFHVLLYLYRRDFLVTTEMVNLFAPTSESDPSLWNRLASGLKAYYAEMKAQAAPKRSRKRD